MANELFASARRQGVGIGRNNLVALAWPIALLLVAALLALPLWPWSHGLGYRPSGAFGILDLALIAGLVGRG